MRGAIPLRMPVAFNLGSRWKITPVRLVTNGVRTGPALAVVVRLLRGRLLT